MGKILRIAFCCPDLWEVQKPIRDCCQNSVAYWIHGISHMSAFSWPVNLCFLDVQIDCVD